jgi:hypothetical protein
MRIHLVAALVVVLPSLSACVARKPPTVEYVPTPPPRYAARGYSLVPTDEPGWVIPLRNVEQIHFGKRGTNTDESFTIHAILIDLPTPLTASELAVLMKDRESRDAQSERMKLVKHEVTVSTHAGADCVRSYVLTIDGAPVRQSSRADPLEIEALVLTCRHPRDPKTGVSVGYTQRRYPEHQDPAFRSKAEIVLRSVEFTELTVQGSGSVNCVVGGKRDWVSDASKCD